MSGERWARLTWQAADPDALAGALAVRLGVDGAPTGDGGWRLDLGGEPLDVVPWRREGPGDDPRPAGRLVLEPIDGGGPVPAPAPDAPLALAGVAWATVELERAEGELGPWLLPAGGADSGEAAPDPQLGARTRVRRTVSLPGSAIVFAEPSTEGRLAASLARDGEGPCALYLRPAAGLDAWVAAARARGVKLSGRRPGPLGEAVLLPGAAFAGPHVLIADAPASRFAPSTIAP